MKMTLHFVRETDLARLYRWPDGREAWIPRSIVRHTSKNPDGTHIVDLPDWKIEELEKLDEAL